jgi:hypothetical protein
MLQAWARWKKKLNRTNRSAVNRISLQVWEGYISMDKNSTVSRKCLAEYSLAIM